MLMRKEAYQMSKASTVEQSFARIHKWLEKQDPARHALASLLPPATEAEIEQFEAKTKLQLPDPVKALYRLHNGQNEDLGNEAAGDQIESGLFPSIESGDLAYLLVPLKELIRNTPKRKSDSRMPGFRLGWIPIGDNYGGDNIVIDLAIEDETKHGRVLQFNHEYGGATVLADSFNQYLAQLADDLKAGRVIWDDDCGLSYKKGKNWDSLIDAGKVEYDPEFQAEFG
jgi:cell wall assembly regulator SMI1